jgi:hypothetical protein
MLVVTIQNVVAIQNSVQAGTRCHEQYQCPHVLKLKRQTTPPGCHHLFAVRLRELHGENAEERLNLRLASGTAGISRLRVRTQNSRGLCACMTFDGLRVQ